MSTLTNRDDARRRLFALFNNVDFKEHGSRWDSLWQTGDLPWDAGLPNPALVDTLAERGDLLGSPLSKIDGITRRKRALVPGCGRGYDVLLLASQGYDAYGLEISPEALKACNKFAEENVAQYTKAPSENGSGKYDFLLGDFFKNDDWRKATGNADEGFDLVYDYTFLSALPPTARPAWSLRHANLLKPGGKLICVEFPTYKDPESGGPPFALPPEVYVAHLTKPGEELPYQSGLPKKDSYETPGPHGLQRVAHWQPERTHDIGKGTDWVSIWQRK